MAQIATPIRRPRPYAWGFVTYVLILAALASILAVVFTTTSVLVSFGFAGVFGRGAWVAWQKAKHDARAFGGRA